MPPKCSKALHKKNKLIGTYTKNKKLLSVMESKISEQNKELDKLAVRSKRKHDQSIEYLETEKTSKKSKSSIEVSQNLVKIRQANPSNVSLKSRNRIQRRSETWTVCHAIHGGNNQKPDATIDGCHWEFRNLSIISRFVAKKTIKATTFNIRLLEKTHFPDGQLCRNYTDGKIEVQNTYSNLNTSIWDAEIGEHIKRTLTYQYDYSNKFVTVAFTKHWDGMLIANYILIVWM